MRKAYKTPNGFVSIATGEEGPSYDPYSFCEIAIERNGSTLVLHSGLVVYLEKNGHRTYSHELCGGSPDDRESALIEVFERRLGCSLRAFGRALDRRTRRCRECGDRNIVAVSGHLGETVYICRRHHVVDCSYNAAEVI